MTVAAELLHDGRDINQILEAIPHRPPFLFLDHIIDCNPGEYAKSLWVLKEDTPFLAGHFPGHPVMPGVLLLEMMAQTACFAMASASSDAGLYLLAKVESASFSRQVLPGQEVVTEARLTRQVQSFSFFTCECRCEGQRAAKAQLLVAFKS